LIYYYYYYYYYYYVTFSENLRVFRHKNNNCDNYWHLVVAGGNVQVESMTINECILRLANDWCHIGVNGDGNKFIFLLK